MSGGRLPGTAEVVVIGGGVMGASTAYHLAARGCGDVVLLEAAELFGAGATGLNAGGVRHQFSTAVNVELSRESIAMLERFPEELEQEVELRLCGYLFLLDGEGDLARFRAAVALQNRLGVGSRMVGPAEIADLVPQVTLEGILGGSFCARDGLVDPHGVLSGYLRNARRLGATLLTRAPVLAIRAEAGRVLGVTTPLGDIDAPRVVIAAGPWSGEVGRLAGIDLPVRPVRRQIAVTTPLPALAPEFPFVIDFSRALYFHRESGGVLTGMSNPDEPPGFETSVDPEWRAVHIAHAIERLPLLAEAGLAAEWAGLYEVTPDDQPILGRLPQIDGLYACTGFSGHGLMHGPVAGLLLAEEILDGRARTVDIEPLRWTRFEDASATGEYNVV